MGSSIQRGATVPASEQPSNSPIQKLLALSKTYTSQTEANKPIAAKPRRESNQETITKIESCMYEKKPLQVHFVQPKILNLLVFLFFKREGRRHR